MSKFKQIIRAHNGYHDIILRNQCTKTNVNRNSYILTHKHIIEIKCLIKNDKTFIRRFLTLKCLGVFTLNTHANKYYHMLARH